MSTIHWAGGIPGNYGIATDGTWVGGIAPGTLDIGLFDAAQAGPYNLTGTITLGELAVVGNQVSIRGAVTASDALTIQLSVLDGGTATIAAAATFAGNSIVQVGTAGSPG